MRRARPVSSGFRADWLLQSTMLMPTNAAADVIMSIKWCQTSILIAALRVDTSAAAPYYI